MKTINATVYIKPDELDTFLSIGNDLISETRKEPGNIKFDLYKNNNGASSFVFIETYQSQEAIIEHRDSNHFQKFLKEYQKVQNAPMDVMIFEGLGSQN